MTCNSTMRTEYIVAFPLQRELQKLANTSALRYTCIFYLVTAFVQLTNCDTKSQILTTPLPADDGPIRFETCRSLIF
jgi:hypothetical protein